jgi:hypothetical protein
VRAAVAVVEGRQQRFNATIVIHGAMAGIKGGLHSMLAFVVGSATHRCLMVCCTHYAGTNQPPEE